MVGGLASRHALSTDVIDGVSERTGGVPLFVEEVTRLLLERGVEGGAQAIPPTLQQSLAARLDRLGEARGGIEAAPGSVIPSASAALVIVEAVPIVMQSPGDRAMPCSISSQSSAVMPPARRSAQYFQTSLPDPSGRRARRRAAWVPQAGRSREIHRDRAHQQCGRGLVAAAHQHGAVRGIGAKRLFRLHRQEIAINHRRRRTMGLRDGIRAKVGNF